MTPPMTSTPVDRDDSSQLWSSWPLRGRELMELALAYMTLVTMGLAAGWTLLGPLSDTPLARFDVKLVSWFATVRTSSLDFWSDVGSAFSDTINVIILLTILVVAMTWYWRRWRESLTLGLGVGLEALVFVVVSLVLGRDRPPVTQLDPSPPTASFPSGHVGAAFALYVGLALIVFWNTESRLWRTLAVTLAAVVPLAVALSRMYRGMHFLTDVIGGAMLGLLCLVTAALVVRRGVARRWGGGS
ncbi:MAG TPA: phosphatase PAP2 family protein [Acidimicrobiia bacterium]